MPPPTLNYEEPYYLTRSGAMVTGVRWIDGTRYVFDAAGRLLT